MLQTLNLQLTTNAISETRLDPESTALQAALGEDLEPQQDFASLLEIEPAVGQQLPINITDGENLPLPGKLLPHAPSVSAEQRDSVRQRENGEPAPDVLQQPMVVGMPVLPVLPIIPGSAQGLQLSSSERRPADLRQGDNRPVVTLQLGQSRPSLDSPAIAESNLASSWEHSFKEAADLQPRVLQRPAAGPAASIDVEQLGGSMSGDELEVGSRRELMATAGTGLLPGRDQAVQLMPTSLEKQPIGASWQQTIDELAPTHRTQPDTVMSVSMRPMAANPGGTTAPATGPMLAVGVPIDNLDWGQQLGERVLFMAGNKLQSAEIRLSPAEMGPLRVQVSVDDGITSVTFHAQNALTREALEQSLPRLRELFSEQGLSLDQASVNEQGVNREQGDGRFADGQVVFDTSEIDDSDSESQAPATVGRHADSVSTSLVDTFV